MKEVAASRSEKKDLRRVQREEKSSHRAGFAASLAAEKRRKPMKAARNAMLKSLQSALQTLGQRAGTCFTEQLPDRLRLVNKPRVSMSRMNDSNRCRAKNGVSRAP